MKKCKKLTYGLPPEMLTDGVVMRVLDHSGCVLEGNYRIREYTEEKLQIEVGWGDICFLGEAFSIQQMDGMMLSFTGDIHQVIYQA